MRPVHTLVPAAFVPVATGTKSTTRANPHGSLQNSLPSAIVAASVEAAQIQRVQTLRRTGRERGLGGRTAKVQAARETADTPGGAMHPIAVSLRYEPQCQ
jgi:hypothetical protein